MDTQLAGTGAATRSRVRDVDSLRGFALLGILIVNITFFTSGYAANLVDDPNHSSDLDQVVHWVSSVLVDMKFYVLFSFLFGYSFTLQMGAAERAGAAFRPRMLRRIGGLFVLGVLHIVLLYSGDILASYAVLGVMLLAMRRVTDRTALVTAGVLYGLTILSMLVSALLLDPSTFLPPAAEAQENARQSTEAMGGGLAEVAGENLAGIPLLFLVFGSLQGPTAMALFLLGLVAGRRRLLAGVTGREPLLRRVQLVGFPIGIAGGVVYASAGGNGDTFGVAASVATAPFLAAAYVATLLRIAHSTGGRGVGAALAPAGRMALTNYLSQSLVCFLVFTGVGLGLTGELSAVETMAVAVAIFAAQLGVSAWWLRGHAYGPVEWLLRWVTNASRPAWRF